MNREQAIDKAVEIVGKWADAPAATGRNFGNSADKFATLADKTKAVLEIAEFLWEPEGVSIDATREEQSTRD